MTPEAAIKQFVTSVNANRLAQAYILQGNPSGEAAEVAGCVLERVFCSDATPPCGACHGCVAVRNRRHPDVLWVEPQKKSRRISVDQVRQLQRLIFQTSFEGGWKACVVRGADRLGREAANAFLKTLEEPPARSVFFLLTDSPQALLPTIVSRCQRVVLSGGKDILTDGVRDRLVEVLTGDPTSVTQAFARGESVAALLKDIKSGIAEAEESAATEVDDEDDNTIDARISARYREVRTAVLRALQHWYRDVLLLTSDSDPALLYYQDAGEVLATIADQFGYGGALTAIRLVGDMERQLEMNLPEASVLSFGFSRMVGSQAT